MMYLCKASKNFVLPTILLYLCALTKYQFTFRTQSTTNLHLFVFDIHI
jgi:hypothetical protein